MWHYLFNTKSGNEVGTLYHARQVLKLRNVTKDPHGNFYAAEGLLDTFQGAYILAGALHYFELDSFDSEPLLPCFTEGTSEQERQAYVDKVLLDFIRHHILNPPPSSVEELLKCRFCQKVYKQKNALVKHERKHREDLQANLTSDSAHSTICSICGKKYARKAGLEKHMNAKHSAPNSTEQGDNRAPNPDYVYNYTRMSPTLSCLRLNMEDAIKRGDGGRVILCYKYMYLYCKQASFSKYAYGLLETVAQATCLLPPKEACDLIWNRFVNNQGKEDTNFLIDLDVEHHNKPLKTDISTFRGEITEKCLQRVSRSLQDTEAILHRRDQDVKVKRPSGKHKGASRREDTVKLSLLLHTKGFVFHQIPNREHKSFGPVPANPLSTLDMTGLHKWLRESVRGFSRKHYYKAPEQP